MFKEIWCPTILISKFYSTDVIHRIFVKLKMGHWDQKRRSCAILLWSFWTTIGYCQWTNSRNLLDLILISINLQFATSKSRSYFTVPANGLKIGFDNIPNLNNSFAEGEPSMGSFSVVPVLWCCHGMFFTRTILMRKSAFCEILDAVSC